MKPPTFTTPTTCKLPTAGKFVDTGTRLEQSQFYRYVADAFRLSQTGINRYDVRTVKAPVDLNGGFL